MPRLPPVRAIICPGRIRAAMPDAASSSRIFAAGFSMTGRGKLCRISIMRGSSMYPTSSANLLINLPPRRFLLQSRPPF